MQPVLCDCELVLVVSDMWEVSRVGGFVGAGEACGTLGVLRVGRGLLLRLVILLGEGPLLLVLRSFSCCCNM